MAGKVAEKSATPYLKDSARKRLSILPGNQSTSTLIATMKTEFGLSQDDLVRLTSYSPRSIASWSKGTKATKPAATKFKEVGRLLDALAHITQNKKEVGEWMKEPNEAFDGSTPVQVIERGEIDRIWEMIYYLRSGQPT